MKTTLLPDVRSAKSTAAPVEEFVMPCSISQQRFWVLDQLTAGNSALNIPLALEMTGPLDVEALHKALNAVVDRHETLRTTFAWIDDEVKQVIGGEVHFQLQHKDLTDVPEDQQQVRILEEMNAEAVKPLSLATAPIMRAKLLRLDENYHVLLVTLHHIICDGWSNGILVKEIGVFYHAILEDRSVDLPPLPIQYADYALWQKDWIASPDFARQLGYWEKELAGGLPTLDFPTDHPRKTGRMFPSYIESLLLPQRLSNGVKNLCQEYDLTVFMVLFAAYTCLIHRYTGQNRFVVGTTVANRPQPELEPLIGEFANPVMLCADLDGNPTFREVLNRVRDVSLGAMSHQEVPFELILETLENKTIAGEKPAIQAFFLYQKAFMHPAQYGTLKIRPLRSVSPGTTFEFTLAIVERGEGIRLQWEYNTALFEKETVRRQLRHFQRLLEAALEAPDSPVEELVFLTEEERAKILSADTAAGMFTARPLAKLASTLDGLQSQLENHFSEAKESVAAVLKTPPGVTPFVLDANLHLLPFGVLGALYLGGVSGKAGRVEYAGPAEAPMPGPLIRTEFIGRYREDGTIELSGHESDFVHVGGFRVNLRQVNALLMRDPAVADATSIVRPHARTGLGQLVSYVVARPGAAISENNLRALLQEKVSDFTLPASIIAVPTITRNAQGEVVTALLPQPGVQPKLKNNKVPLEAILYQQLKDIWTDILKVPNISIDDNFFALGGTSLQALRMMVQIEKLCGRTLPLSLLLSGATVANIARHIVEAKGEKPVPLVVVQDKGTKPPIFFLHGDWAGGGFYCGRLSELLGDDQPFYALPPHRLGKDEVLTMEDMAAHHIAAIRAHTPHGPYILGGYCIGATVAIETARQLLAKGETVQQLLLIDLPLRATPWLRWVWPFIDRIGEMAHWDLQRKIYWFDFYAVSFARWLRRSRSEKMDTIRRRLGFKVRARSAPDGTDEVRPGEGDMEILKSMDYAVYFLAYRLYYSNHAENVTVPTSIVFPQEGVKTNRSWVKRLQRDCAARIDVEIVPGDHHTCITQHMRELVEKMRQSLRASAR